MNQQRPQQHSVKPANLDQLWSCLQRCLLFEDPSSRWEKLTAQVSRHVNIKARDLPQLSLSETQNLFRKVFGTPDDLLDVPARFFNLVLAMQDLRRFEAANFDMWYLSQLNEPTPIEFDAIFSELAEKILETAPNPAQVASLWQAWNVVPYWRLLESYGPWADDPLAELASAFLRKLDKMALDLNIACALACESELDKLLKSARSKLPNNFMPGLLVLVEGPTETILLPRFLLLSGNNKSKSEGVQKENEIPTTFISCGGANQLLRKYLHLRDTTRLPILCVVDHDAAEQIKTIGDVLRENDDLHVWSVGEIEDTFAQEIMLNSLNGYLQSLGASDLLLPEDMETELKRTEILDRLWRNRGLGDFDKVGFAGFLVARLKQSGDVPPEGRQLMDTIRRMVTANKLGG